MARRIGTIAAIFLLGLLVGALAQRALRTGGPGPARGSTQAVNRPPGPAVPPAPEVAPPTDEDQGSREWLAEIVARLDREAAVRHRLEEEVAALGERVDALDLLVARAEGQREPWTEPAEPPAAAAPEAGEGLDPSLPLDQRLAALGMAEGRAAEIAQRVNARELDILYLRDQATREGWLNTPRFAEAMRDVAGDPTTLREEIGDADYDRYLFATGQPNRVVVESVIPGSAAQEAGITAGDLLLQYDDRTIFSGTEVQAATVAGQAGERVAITVLRGGERIQHDVPRGPLGIRFQSESLRPDSRP